LLQRTSPAASARISGTDLLYEEAPARAILAERPTGDGGPSALPGTSREYLVSWADGRSADTWVLERDVSESLLEDWRAGMEAAPAAAVLDMVQVGRFSTW
jgi:hypothetical protein